MKVFIQQPVIPRYRVPLFNALSKRLNIEVHASEKIPGLPTSEDSSTYQFKFFNHTCNTSLGERLYFQEEMEIPESFGVGDILIYNSNPRFRSNSKLVSQAKKKGMAVIAWNHANSSTSSGLKSWLRKKVTAVKADKLLLYTESEIEYMKGLGWNESDLFYLNNTQDESLIIEAAEKCCGNKNILEARQSGVIRDFKRSQEIKSLHFLYCGRITDKSDLELLIEALKKVDKNIELTLIGDGEQKGKLQTFRLPSSIKINWLGAIYDEEKLAPWFLSADAFIYPGAIGLSLNHAMSYGLPVITHNSKSNQMPEFSYLEEGVNGLTYEFRDLDSLANLLSSLTLEKLEKTQEAAFRTMHTKVTFKKMIDNFVNCVKAVSKEN